MKYRFKATQLLTVLVEFYCLLGRTHEMIVDSRSRDMTWYEYIGRNARCMRSRVRERFLVHTTHTPPFPLERNFIGLFSKEVQFRQKYERLTKLQCVNPPPRPRGILRTLLHAIARCSCRITSSRSKFLICYLCCIAGKISHLLQVQNESTGK